MPQLEKKKAAAKKQARLSAAASPKKAVKAAAASAKPSALKTAPAPKPPLSSAKAAVTPKADTASAKPLAAIAAAPARSASREKDRPLEGSALKQTADGRGKYVYCIIQASEPLRFGPLGIGSDPADVHTINFKDIAAVVSDTPIEVHDPTRENVLAHERVNETVMRKHTVIPMSFGTVFKTRDDIMELLRSAYEAFRDVLMKMQDKLEFGLKVLWDREVMVREIESLDEDVRRLKQEISAQKGSTYFARMQYGRLVDAALQAHSEKYVAEIFETLRDVAVASRANRPIGDKMIMNAAFLVSRDKESAFDARVKEIGARFDKLTFKYTGPWPPYNFVNIRLKLERAKEK